MEGHDQGITALQACSRLQSEPTGSCLKTSEVGSMLIRCLIANCCLTAVLVSSDCSQMQDDLKHISLNSRT